MKKILLAFVMFFVLFSVSQEAYAAFARGSVCFVPPGKQVTCVTLCWPGFFMVTHKVWMGPYVGMVKLGEGAYLNGWAATGKNTNSIMTNQIKVDITCDVEP